MKKILLIVFLILILTSCDLFKKEDNKDYNEIILKDDKFGITTFRYDKEKVFNIEENKKIKPVELNITSEDDDFNLDIYHINTSIEGYETSKKNRKKSNSYKEYTWNNYRGYTYNGSKDNINFIILLKEDEENSIGLFGTLRCSNQNTIKYFEDEQFQKILNTISYKETIEDD